jgi:hypothetical protein
MQQYDANYVSEQGANAADTTNTTNTIREVHHHHHYGPNGEEVAGAAPGGTGRRAALPPPPEGPQSEAAEEGGAWGAGRSHVTRNVAGTCATCTHTPVQVHYVLCALGLLVPVHYIYPRDVHCFDPRDTQLGGTSATCT